MVGLDRAATELNLVRYLAEAEFAFERLKVAALCIVVIIVRLIQTGSIGRVLLLLLGRFAHLANLLDLVRQLALYLQRVLGPGQILLVASYKDRHFLLNRIDIAEQIVEDLSGLAELGFLLGIEEKDDSFGAS